MRRSTLTLSLLALCLAACSAPHPGLQMASPGRLIETEGLRLSGGHLYLPRDEAAVLFSVLRFERAEPRFGYVLIIEHGTRDRLVTAGRSGSVRADGRRVLDTSAVSIAGHEVALAYAAEADPSRPDGLLETFAVNGEPVDLERGRVLRVDLTGSAVTWRPTTVELPRRPAVDLDDGDVARIGRQVLSALATRQ